MKTHCKNGHELTPENVRIEKRGYRRCRICERASSAKYLASPRGQARSSAYFKRINSRPDRKTKLKGWQEKSYGAGAGRVRMMARRKVQWAIKKGALSRQPCEVCGSTQSDAHHDDYSKPLDVRWLCRVHHREWHRLNKPKMPEPMKSTHQE